MKSASLLLNVRLLSLIAVLSSEIFSVMAFAQGNNLVRNGLNIQEEALRGTQNEVIYTSAYGNGQQLGYLEYLPSGYDKTSVAYPLIISLHGIDQRASGEQIEFDKLKEGGQLAKRVIEGRDFPFIIITPQQPENVKGRYSGRGSWDPYIVDEVLERVKTLRRVDLNRIYICGESMGGGGVWKYLEIYGDKIAAAVPIAATSTVGVEGACNSKIKGTPIWTFHCDRDAIVNVQSTLDMVEAINECNPTVKAKQTIFYSRGHNAWDWTYDFDERVLSPMYQNSSFGPISRTQDIFSWMLSHRLNNDDKNENPVADAGQPQVINVLDSIVQLDGGKSYDRDGDIVQYSWKQVSGPVVDVSDFNQAMINLEGLQDGTYTFELTVTDNKGAKALDSVTVVAKAEAHETYGLRYAYFEGEWHSLPDFRYVVPKKTGIIRNVNLDERLEDDNFGFVFKGNIEIREGGEYTFYLNSDDGSRLYIDNDVVVENDRTHSSRERNGRLFLEPGMHAIELMYFERLGHETLEFSYEGPGFDKTIVPNEVLYPGEESNFSLVKPDQIGLNYWYYEGDWLVLPDFNGLQPKGEGVVSDFTLEPRKTDSKFAFRYKGYLAIDQEGEYEFFITSDDGSKLYIDGNLVVDNDGQHAARESQGKISLKPGMHAIELTYFEQVGHEILEVSYSGPDFDKKSVPSEKLFAKVDHPTLACGENGMAKTEDFVKAYPTYLENELNIEYRGADSKEFRLIMYDQYGKIYYTNNVTFSQDQLFRVDLLPVKIPSGLVYLRLENEAYVQVVRLFKP